MTSSQTPKKRSEKGPVQITLSHERLQLVFRVAGQRYYRSTGLPDSPTNRKMAEMKARQIELDIVSGNFDTAIDSIDCLL